MTTTVVVAGLGIAAPNGLGTQDYLGRHPDRQERHRAGHPLRPVLLPVDPGGRGARIRRRGTCCRAGSCRRPTT